MSIVSGSINGIDEFVEQLINTGSCKKTIEVNNKILINLNNSTKQDNSLKIDELKNKNFKLNELIVAYDTNI